MTTGAASCPWRLSADIVPSLCPPCRLHLSLQAAYVIGAHSLVSIPGNVLVIWAVKSESNGDATFCFIASLAVADVAVGALVIPLYPHQQAADLPSTPASGSPALSSSSSSELILAWQLLLTMPPQP